MKKNIVIIILAALGIMFGLYGFAQKVKADQNIEEAIKQQEIIEELKRKAEVPDIHSYSFTDLLRS